jgi:glycerate dehydrogenase
LSVEKVPTIRLLLGIPDSRAQPELLRRILPGISHARVRDTGPQDWSGVEALLVGDLNRDFPGFQASFLPKLKFVQSLYTGVDDLPFDHLPSRVQVAGNGGAFAPFVAEHAVAMILALAKNLRSAQVMVLEGRLRPIVPSLYLEGRTALIVGFGSIGKETGRRLKALGLVIHGVSRVGRPDPAADRMFPSTDLGDAIANADVIVNCLPLTRQTEGIFGDPELAVLKPEAIFVNVGRAATINEEALLRHLRAHPEARFGLDVWWAENFAHRSFTTRLPLRDFPNVLGTPHSAGITTTSRQRVLEMALMNLARFFQGERPRHIATREEIPVREGSVAHRRSKSTPSRRLLRDPGARQRHKGRR